LFLAGREIINGDEEELGFAQASAGTSDDSFEFSEEHRMALNSKPGMRLCKKVFWSRE
jgi:hypothetical protein